MGRELLDELLTIVGRRVLYIGRTRGLLKCMETYEIIGVSRKCYYLKGREGKGYNRRDFVLLS